MKNNYNFGEFLKRMSNAIYVHTLTFSREGRYRRTIKPHIKCDIVGRVLDAGCAYGMSTAELLSLHPRAQIVGMDINPQNIEDALRLRESLPDRTKARLEFVVGNFYHLDPAVTGVFTQIIAANNVLNAAHYWTERHLHIVLNSLYNSLDNNGSLILTDGDSLMALRKNDDGNCFKLEKDFFAGKLIGPACESGFFSPLYEPEDCNLGCLKKTVDEKLCGRYGWALE